MSRKGHNVLLLLETGPFIADTRPKREAKALIEAGYRVSVICPRHKDSRFYEVVNGAHVYGFPMPPHSGGIPGYLMEYTYGLAVMFALCLVVWLRDGIDIVHAHNPPDILFLASAFFKLFGKKIVFDHRDLSPELYQMRFVHGSNGLLYRLLLLFEYASCRLADRILATNASYRNIEITRDKVPASRVFIVRNGPDSETQPVTPDPELRKQSGAIIGYVGVMGPQDGVDYLLRALHYLATNLDHPDFYCVLIGDGHAVKELRVLTRTLGLEARVWFAGWILDRKELLKYLSTADICVQPDPTGPLNDVSTMIKTMEYMALSKPVVAFDLPDTRYSCGDTALYAQPNDERDFARQIARLMDDAKLRRQLGEQGRQRIIAGLTWEHAVVNLRKAYETLDT
jgi:glycosyltransferase involved in cell wall biosynthesis